MSLTLAFCTIPSNDCSSISIRETTGIYSAGNTGGWGTPNPEISDALTATISIAKRNSDGTYGTTYTIDAYPTLPNTEDVEFEFTATELGIGSSFTDGIYLITYTVTGNDGSDFTATTTQYKAITCSIDCCYQTMADNVSSCSCGCTDVEDKFNQVATFYRLLQGAKCCGQLDAIQSYIDKLNRICGSCGCGC